MELKNAKIIVTGAAQGMGAHYARRLHEAGSRVAAGDVNEAALAELPAGIERRRLDVSDEADVRAFVAWAEQGHGGVILNVTSGETTRPAIRLAPYGAAKAAINHLTQTMAVELGPHAIRVNSIAPGTTLTEQVRKTFPESHVAAILESIPLRRMTEPEELGRLALFLASDLARSVTGQFMLADAGAILSRSRPAMPPAPAGR